MVRSADSLGSSRAKDRRYRAANSVCVPVVAVFPGVRCSVPAVASPAHLNRPLDGISGQIPPALAQVERDAEFRVRCSRARMVFASQLDEALRRGGSGPGDPPNPPPPNEP